MQERQPQNVLPLAWAPATRKIGCGHGNNFFLHETMAVRPGPVVFAEMDARMRAVAREVERTCSRRLSDVSPNGTDLGELIREGFRLIVTTKE